MVPEEDSECLIHWGLYAIPAAGRVGNVRKTNDSRRI